MSAKPIVIISAARSGTKMLRYILDASVDIASCHYDANYIWKYGNYYVKHDEVSPNSIDNKQREKIRSFFNKICLLENKNRLLEKSVSNSLRIPLVRSVFPDCKIIHLYRNGLDVAADSRRCWQASAVSEDIQSNKDRIRKVKEFPFMMAWPYLLDYTLNYGKKLLLMHDHVSSWGPRYAGIDKDVREKSLIEVCAIQWKKCVEHCCDELGNLEKEKHYINIPYDNMAYDPEKYIKHILDFIQISDGHKVLKRAKETITPKFVGFGEKVLDDNEIEIVNSIIFDTQERIRYLE
ncbi:hypothetical protein JCM14469_14230 [Desulfatiferula olefinivorans]